MHINASDNESHLTYPHFVMQAIMSPFAGSYGLQYCTVGANRIIL